MNDHVPAATARDTIEQKREIEEDMDDVRAYDAAAPRAKVEIARGDFVTLADYQKERAEKRR